MGFLADFFAGFPATDVGYGLGSLQGMPILGPDPFHHPARPDASLADLGDAHPDHPPGWFQNCLGLAFEGLAHEIHPHAETRLTTGLPLTQGTELVVTHPGHGNHVFLKPARSLRPSRRTLRPVPRLMTSCIIEVISYTRPGASTRSARGPSVRPRAAVLADDPQ